MKKTVLFLIMVSLLTIVLFSCSEGDSPEIFIPPEPDETVDFNGYEFVFLLNGAENDGEILTYKESTLVADAAYKRISDIEENYNIVFKEKFTSNITNALQLAIAGNDTSISATQWTAYSNAMVDCSRAGYFVAMSEVSDYIDITDSEKWGNKGRLEVLCWNNEVYGVLPMAWPEYDLCNVDFLLVINTDYITALAEEDPREFIEAGVWNRDKFTEKIVAYSHYNASNNWIYGLSANKYHFAVSTSVTSGVDMVSKDSNGNWSVTGLFSNTAIDSFNWMRNLFYGEYADCIIPTSNDSTEEVMQYFADRNAVMMLMHSAYVYQTNLKTDMSISHQDIPFAILPFPNADDVSDDKWVTIYGMLRYSTNIPVFTEEPEASAFILNALYEPLDGFETKEILREYYERNVFHDSRDADVFYKMAEGCTQMYRADGFNPIITDIAFETEFRSVVEVTQSLENQVNEILVNTIIPMKESAIAVFGE